MKINHKKLGGVLALGLLALGARAVVVLHDNFDSYPVSGPHGLTNDSTLWIAHSGAAPINVVGDSSVSAPNALQIDATKAQDVNAQLTNAPYSTAGTNGIGDPVTALYYKFTLRMSNTNLPTGSGAYFAHLKDATTGYAARLFASPGAVSGTFRLGIANYTGSATNIANDLNTNTTYVVVVRYVLTNGFSTLWINPNSESDAGVTDTNTSTSSPKSLYAMAFRQNSGEGTMNVDDLVAGTTFNDIVTGKPIVTQDPQDASVFAGAKVSFSTAAFGVQPVAYQWYSVTNGVTNALFDSSSVLGSISNILVLSNLTVDASGAYYCMLTNVAGTNFTRSALLSVAPAAQAPIITSQPVGSTNIVGDNVSFSVVANGIPDPAYQWLVVTNGVTNHVAGANVSGAGSDTLNISGVTADQAGLYFVTMTNMAGSTNSDAVSLVVNPVPSFTIGALRSMVDGSYEPTNHSMVTFQGIVISQTNTTGAANCGFYVEDNTGGIAVFWSGANGSNCPPAGALVHITAPFESPSYNGLLTMEPVFGNPLHGVTILSTNNPLPAAQPLPMDPNVTFAQLKALESSYVVASNVTLAAGATFTGGANEFITNNAEHAGLVNSLTGLTFTNHVGDVFDYYINYYTDIPGQTKPSGPVAVYGVLGVYNTQYELTPTRYADIVTYIHTTNVLTNARKGDAPTNSYTENVLRSGETQTTYVSIGDPDGGNVTLTPVTNGLPAGANWSDITGGTTGTAVFHLTPVIADSGNNYLVSLKASSTSGATFTNSFTVYVPTTNEQLMAISEFLTNPTTNTAAPNFNPLKRATDAIGVSTNDQYIEVANISGSDLAAGWTLDYGNLAKLMFDSYAVGAGVSVPSSNSVVIYSGGSESPGLATPLYASTLAGGLGLRTSSSGLLILRNQNGNIIDRVVYAAGDVNTNGSLTRFPNINGPFVPQPWVSVNLNTPGLQYDGSAWNKPFKVPAGVNNVGISATNGKVMFNFTANTGLASTLWSAGSLTGPYNVIYGRQFQTASGAFTNTPVGTMQFYFISNQ